MSYQQDCTWTSSILLPFSIDIGNDLGDGICRAIVDLCESLSFDRRDDGGIIASLDAGKELVEDLWSSRLRMLEPCDTIPFPDTIVAQDRQIQLLGKRVDGFQASVERTAVDAFDLRIEV